MRRRMWARIRWARCLALSGWLVAGCFAQEAAVQRARAEHCAAEHGATQHGVGEASLQQVTYVRDLPLLADALWPTPADIEAGATEGVTQIEFPPREAWVEASARNEIVEGSGMVLEIYDASDLVVIPNFPGGCSFGGDDSEDEAAAARTEPQLASPPFDAEVFSAHLRDALGEECWADPASLEVHRGQLIVHLDPGGQRALRDELLRLRRLLWR